MSQQKFYLSKYGRGQLSPFLERWIDFGDAYPSFFKDLIHYREIRMKDCTNVTDEERFEAEQLEKDLEKHCRRIGFLVWRTI